MPKSKSLSALLLVGLFLSSFSTTYAYWQGSVSSANKNTNIVIGIGSWEWSSSGDDQSVVESPVNADDLPLGEGFEDAVDEQFKLAYKLSVLAQKETPVTLFPGSYFTYDDPDTGKKSLYIVHKEYNVKWNGSTPTSSNFWSRISLDIDYHNIDAYEANHVVRVMNNGVAEFYVTNHYANTTKYPSSYAGVAGSGANWSRITGVNQQVDDIISNWRIYFKPIVVVDKNNVEYEVDYPNYSSMLPNPNTNGTTALNFYYYLDNTPVQFRK